MGVKHRKTLKQKIIADLNRKVYSLENKNIIPLNPTIIDIVNKDSHSYSYVLRDTLKTGLLTFSIIAGELILFFLLKNHMIVLPLVKY